MSTVLFEQEPVIVDIKRELWSDRLISQEQLWDKVLKTINQNRFPHFSLILGSPGNGQLLMALSIAQALFCKSSGRPCGVCDPCRKVKHMIHPDLHYSFPLNNPKETCQENYSAWRTAINEKPYLGISDWFTYLGEGNKNANISVNEIGSFSGLLNLKPYESDINVLILWLPEYLGKDANRLLKLFEEPPANVYVILVSENSELLLPTVLSRAQIYRMQAIQLKEAAKVLSNRFGVSPDAAHAALLSSDKNIQESVRQIEQQTIPSIESLRNLLQSTYAYRVTDMIQWVESFLELNKEEQKYFIEWVQRLLSFVLRIKYSGESHAMEHPMLNYSNKLAGSLTLNQISRWVDLMDDVYLGIQRNANAKILMTDFCIQLSKIIKKN